MTDLNPIHLINNVNHAMGESMADVLEFVGVTDPAVDPDGVREIAKKWRALADALDRAHQDAGTALKDVDWEGQAAKSFHKRATKARGQAEDMAEALRDGARALDQFADQAHEMITEIGVICVEIVEMEAAGLALSVLTAGVSAAATTIASGARVARIVELVAKIEESGSALARVIRGVAEIIKTLQRTLRTLKEVKGVASASRVAGVGMRDAAFDTLLHDPGAFKDPEKLAGVLGAGAVLGVGFGALGKGLGKGLKAMRPSELSRLGKAMKLGGGPARPALRPSAAERQATSVTSLEKKCEFDPIDVATGDMLLHEVDVSLPGTLSLIVERTHLSSCRWGGWFGTTWASTLDQRLQVDDEAITFAAADGARLVYPAPEAQTAEALYPLTGRGPALTWDDEVDGGLRLTEPDGGLAYVFHSPCPLDDDSGVDLPLQTVIDPNGNRITIDYTVDGSPSGISHSGGYRLALDHHPTQPRITAVRLLDPRDPDAAASTTIASYDYDSSGHLTAVTNSSGLPLRFTYDEAGRVTSWTDRNDSSYSYTYDERGRVTRTEGSAGYLTGTLTYDDATRTTEATNSLGHVRRYEHNDAYRLIRETDPLGNVTVQEWDDANRLVSVTDPIGHTTRYSYDDQGRPTEVTRPDGLSLTVAHNHLGLPVETVDADGTTWRRSYDDRGNLTALTDPLGATTRHTYTAQGHLSAVTDALGNTTIVQCDPAGLPLTVTDPLGATTRYRRDASGRPTKITDPLGAVTRLTWTPEGKPARRQNPDGSAESWTYDGEGNCLTHTDALGQVTTYEYTHFGLVAARTDPDGTRHAFTHGHDLRLREVTNPQGLTWSYTYDPVGRLTAETDFDDRTITYEHDAAGRTTTRTTPLGDVIRYTHDRLGNVATKDAAGTLTRYAYDPAGRLQRAVSADHELSRRYDPAGRTTHETIDGRTVTHTYDILGRPLQRTTPTGATTRYSYDVAGNRTELITATGHTLASSHDPLGRELLRTLASGAFSIAYTWAPNGRLARQHLASGTDAVRTRDYRYRPDGHLTSVGDSRTGESRYTLDAAGRVTGVSARDWTETYAYDDAGNQTSATWPDRYIAPEARGERTYTGTRIHTAGSIRFEHDAAGRPTLRQQTRLSRKPASWHYTWNAEDQLTEVTTPDGTRWRYTYDPLGRRSAKLRLASDGTVAERVEFTWDGPTLVEQTTTAPRQLPHPVTLTWDHDGLHPVGQTERRLDTATQHEIDARFFAIATDLVGTPTELIDSGGNLAWHTRTTVWGTTTWSAKSTAYTPLGFPGQYLDPETGLHYNHHRYYDPATARYLTPDPLGLAPAPNPVTYVHNPHTWTDILGLAPGECPKTGMRINPRGYTSIFEMKLDPSDFGRSRAVHFNRANASLDSAISNDPALGRFLDQFSPGIADRVSSSGGRRTPLGFTWQHEPSANAGGEQGVMRLVPTYQHTPGSPWWDVLHPGNSGGYAQWGIPNGAPPNSRR
ncbi:MULTISPECIES: RHS repeat-associated core domain-containing protein [unclassified Streptomyces]|uniref:RHS repeat-associated core domain-containing protein n=1 Tax=unclassified Streptomyces TaxID=2593676 RepID=UPI00278BFFC6|nr:MULTISPECIES: RHS repeat-associated core domain-containing protein [unclassified Streptomyces]